MDIKLLLIALTFLSTKENIKGISQDFKDLTRTIEKNYSYENLSTGQLFDILWDDNFTNGYRDISYIDGSVYTEPFSDYDFIIKYNEVMDERTEYREYLYRQNDDRFERIIFYSGINFPEPTKLDEASIKKLQEGYDKTILTAYISPDNKLSYIISENHIIIAEISEGVITEEKIIFSAFDQFYDNFEIFWINRNEIFPKFYVVPFENNNHLPASYLHGRDVIEYEKRVAEYNYDTPVRNIPLKFGGKFAFEKDNYIDFHSRAGGAIYIGKLSETGEKQAAAKKINDYIEKNHSYYAATGKKFDTINPEFIEHFKTVFRNDGKILSFAVSARYDGFETLNFDSDGNIITLEDIFTVSEDIYRGRIVELVQDCYLKNFDFEDEEVIKFIKMDNDLFEKSTRYNDIYLHSRRHEYHGLKATFRGDCIYVNDDSIGIDYGIRTALTYADDPITFTIPFEMIEDIINTDLLY